MPQGFARLRYTDGVQGRAVGGLRKEGDHFLFHRELLLPGLVIVQCVSTRACRACQPSRMSIPLEKWANSNCEDGTRTISGLSLSAVLTCRLVSSP
ncbi:hypothetical protein D3C73_1482940 [compost metagenome]